MRANNGCKGISIGGKPTLLCVMELSADLWNEDNKYVRLRENYSQLLALSCNLPPEVQ